MDVPTTISLVIALFALLIALLQVQIQFSIDSRRKGKTDYLALGSWAISWPQTKFFIYFLLRPLGLRSPWGDPRLLTVPIITVRNIEQYLLNEACATQRKPIERRIQERLKSKITSELASGGPAFQRHMYLVRETTRKRSESCWADVMNMCGFERKHWPELSRASAPGCDGVVRPANAVSNVHSLSWYARIMGLRDAARDGTSVTFSNTGAKLYYDEVVHPNSLGPLAHFYGSPGGRYMILDEMSQATGQSVYADSVWAYGRVPVDVVLEVPGASGTRGKAKERDKAEDRIVWPDYVLELLDIDINEWPSTRASQNFATWAAGLSQMLTENSTTNSTGGTDFSIAQFATRRTSTLISCIRTYPLHHLTEKQIRACEAALSWCIKHHWLSPYSLSQRRSPPNDSPTATPFLPNLDCSIINCEYITGTRQSFEWCKAASGGSSTNVDKSVWERCRTAVDSKALDHGARRILLRVIQTWKLFLLYAVKDENYANWGNTDVVTALLALLMMASVSLADDSEWSELRLGPMEENKVLEVELG